MRRSAALYAVFTVWHLVALTPAEAAVMSPLALVTAIVTAALALRFRRAGFALGRAHPVAAIVAVLVLVNCSVQLVLTGGPDLTLNVLMLVIGIGVCMVDPRWVVGLSVGTAAVWVVLTSVVGVPSESGVVSNVTTAVVVSGLSNGLRRRTLWRLVTAQERLEETNRRCDLTGLLNRRGFMDVAGRQVLAGAPTTVWFLDVDGLKVVNDQLGHDEGDVLLRDVAQALTDVFPGAVVARLSGDEFAVLEGACSPDAVAARQARLTEHLDAVARRTGRTTRVSAGTAGARPGDELSDVLAAADAAMYAVKAARRADRVAGDRAPSRSV